MNLTWFEMVEAIEKKDWFAINQKSSFLNLFLNLFKKEIYLGNLISTKNGRHFMRFMSTGERNKTQLFNWHMLWSPPGPYYSEIWKLCLKKLLWETLKRIWLSEYWHLLPLYFCLVKAKNQHDICWNTLASPHLPPTYRWETVLVNRT